VEFAALIGAESNRPIDYSATSVFQSARASRMLLMKVNAQEMP
jgi:hypothetical protein